MRLDATASHLSEPLAVDLGDLSHEVFVVERRGELYVVEIPLVLVRIAFRRFVIVRCALIFVAALESHFQRGRLSHGRGDELARIERGGIVETGKERVDLTQNRDDTIARSFALFGVVELVPRQSTRNPEERLGFADAAPQVFDRDGA